MRISDWSSDVCSSDLFGQLQRPRFFLRAFGLEALGFETLGFETLHLGALGFGALGFGTLGFGTLGFEALGLLRGVAAERGIQCAQVAIGTQVDRKSTRLNSSH